MSSPIERRRLLLGGAALGALPSRASAQSGSGDILEIKTGETATIDGRQWDKTFVGGNTVDAVHRSVLLRFPTAGDEIAEFLRRGRVLIRAELVMHYAGYEIVPENYICRDGMGRKAWTENPPSWQQNVGALARQRLDADPRRIRGHRARRQLGGRRDDL